MLQSAPTRKTSATLVNAASESQHRRKLFLAMLVLFVTLIVVLVRDGQLWFYSGDEAPRPEDTTWVGPSGSSASADVQAPTAPAAPLKTHVAAKSAPEKPVGEPAVVATNRAALPPMNVEVVSGDSRNTVHLRSNYVTDSGSVAATTPLTNVTQRTLTPQAATPAIEQTVVAEYPLLAGQMKVQGSVLLQALIRADGVIEDLRVISGPAILAVAARQAVLQYHFKPYLQNGQPVETSARITVNFAIKVLGDVTAQHHSIRASSTSGF